ncbi:hypothetical protein FACS1894166_09980 [Bacilli bacterium]|nr:hypothetical protein FACS1894166_09980 [Bacilli bacterium]
MLENTILFMKQPPTKELIKHSQEEIDRRILKYEQTFALFDPEHVESDQK